MTTELVTFNKINAIKQVRDWYPHLGLKEAKDLVEMVGSHVIVKVEKKCDLGHIHEVSQESLSQSTAAAPSSHRLILPGPNSSSAQLKGPSVEYYVYYDHDLHLVVEGDYYKVVIDTKGNLVNCDIR